MEKAQERAAVTSSTALDRLIDCHVFKGVETAAQRGLRPGAGVPALPHGASPMIAGLRALLCSYC